MSVLTGLIALCVVLLDSRDIAQTPWLQRTESGRRTKVPITLAMFDMAATSVDDTIDGRPLVLQSFAAAQARVPWEELNAQCGKDKLAVFRTLLARYSALHGAPLEHTAQELLQYFTAQLLRNITHLPEMLGATTVFTFLKERRIFVALGSGFPSPLSPADIASGGAVMLAL